MLTEAKRHAASRAQRSEPARWPPRSGRWADAVPSWAPVALLAAVTLLVYLRFLDTDFVGTDSLPAVESNRVQSLADLIRLWTQPLMAGTDFVVTQALFYRPIASLSFAIDYALWGPKPVGYHLTNTLIQVAAGVLAYAVLRALRLSRLAAFVGAALLAFHPTMATAVPVIARRYDGLSAALLFGALALVCRGGSSARAGQTCPDAAGDDARAGQPGHGVSGADAGAGAGAGAAGAGVAHGRARCQAAAVALFVAALLAKESAFGALPLLPALLFAAWTVRGDSDARQPAAYVRAVGPFVIAAGLVFVGRYLALGQLGGHREVDLTSLNFEEYRVLVNRYVFFVFWPFRHLYPERTVGWAVLVLACLAGLGVGLRLASPRIRVLVGVGLAWAVGYGAFFILLRHVAGPWYLYFPLLGLGLAVGAALDGLRSRLAAGVAPEGGHDTLAPDAVVDGAGDRPASGAALDGARDRPVPGAALDSVRDQLASARALKGALLDPGRSLLGAAALVYTIGCLLASPLVRPFNQWHAAGEVMRRYRLGIQMCTDGLPSEISVTLWNAPKVFDDGTDESYLLFGSMIEGFTYDAYMRLIRPGEHFRLFIGQPVTYRDLPADLDISCGWGGPDRRRVVATSAELPLPAFPTD